jgi:hypothetical protein
VTPATKEAERRRLSMLARPNLVVGVGFVPAARDWLFPAPTVVPSGPLAPQLQLRAPTRTRKPTCATTEEPMRFLAKLLLITLPLVPVSH